MIRSALDRIASALGYVRRPLVLIRDDAITVGEPFTRQEADSALNMAFVQGRPIGMLQHGDGPNNRDLKITLTFRHRTAP